MIIVTTIALCPIPALHYPMISPTTTHFTPLAQLSASAHFDLSFNFRVPLNLVACPASSSLHPGPGWNLEAQAKGKKKRRSTVAAQVCRLQSTLVV